MNTIPSNESEFPQPFWTKNKDALPDLFENLIENVKDGRELVEEICKLGEPAGNFSRDGCTSSTFVVPTPPLPSLPPPTLAPATPPPFSFLSLFDEEDFPNTSTAPQPALSPSSLPLFSFMDEHDGLNTPPPFVSFSSDQNDLNGENLKNGYENSDCEHNPVINGRCNDVPPSPHHFKTGKPPISLADEKPLLVDEVGNREFVKRNNGMVIDKDDVKNCLNDMIDVLTSVINLKTNYDMRNFANFQPIFQSFPCGNNKPCKSATTGEKKGIGDNLCQNFIQFLSQNLKPESTKSGRENSRGKNEVLGGALKRKRYKSSKKTNKKTRISEKFKKGEISNSKLKKEEKMEGERIAHDDHDDDEEENGDEDNEDQNHDDEIQRRQQERERRHREKESRSKRESDNDISELDTAIKSDAQIKKLRTMIDKIEDRCLLHTDDLVKLLNEYNATRKSSSLKGNVKHKSFLEKLLNTENEENPDRDSDKSGLTAAKAGTSAEGGFVSKGINEGGNSGDGSNGSANDKSNNSNNNHNNIFDLPVSSVGVSSTQRLYQIISYLSDKLKKNCKDFEISTTVKKKVTNKVSFEDIVPLFVFLYSFNFSIAEHLTLLGNIFGWDEFRQTVVSSGGLNMHDTLKLSHIAYEMMSKNYHNEIASISLSNKKR